MFLEGVSRERDRFDSILRRNREKKAVLTLTRWNSNETVVFNSVGARRERM